MTKWQKILYGVSGGLLAISTVVPGVNLITLPVFGVLTLKAAVIGAATFAAGVAKTTPGHAPVQK